MEREIDKQIGAAATVMRSLSQFVVVKRELSRKEAEMSFLRRVSSTSRGASWGGSGPRTRWSDYVSQLAWEHLEILLEELEELSWVSEVWAFLLRQLLTRLGPDKQKKMDG